MDEDFEDSNTLNFDWRRDPFGGKCDPLYVCTLGDVALTADSERWTAYRGEGGAREVLDAGDGSREQAEEWYEAKYGSGEPTTRWRERTYDAPEDELLSFHVGPVPVISPETVRHIARNLPLWMSEAEPEPVLERLLPVLVDMVRVAGTDEPADVEAITLGQELIGMEIMSPVVRVVGPSARDIQDAANYGYAVECALYGYLKHARRCGVTPLNEVSLNADNAPQDSRHPVP